MTLLTIDTLRLTEETKQLLKDQQYSTLSDLLKIESSAVERLPASSRAEVSAILTLMHQFILESSDASMEYQATPVDEVLQDVDDTGYNELETIKLSVGARQGLEMMGVKTLDRLSQLNGTALMQTNYFDIHEVTEVLNIIDAYRSGNLETTPNVNTTRLNSEDLERISVTNSDEFPTNWKTISEYIMPNGGESLSVDKILDLLDQYKMLHHLGNIKVPKRSSAVAYFSKSDKMLKTSRDSFRKYDIAQYDWPSFYEAVQIESFDNEVITVDILFNNFPEVMESYNINDRSELHQIIRRTAKYAPTHVTLYKLPVIQVGEADREVQFKEFMLAHAPISQQELLEKYEARYGFNENIMRASAEFESIQPYLVDDIYQTEPVDVNVDMELIKKIIKTKSIFFNDELIEAYERKKKEPLVMNAVWVNELGYRLYNDFLLNAKYKSLNEYYEKRIFNKRVVERDTIDSRLFRLPQFQNYLYELLTDEKFIEVEEGKFIALKELRQYGINKPYLRKLRTQIEQLAPTEEIALLSDVITQVDDDLFGEHQLGEKSYYSVMRGSDEVQMRRLSGRTFIRKSDEAFTSGDIVHQYLVTHGSMPIQELMASMEASYGTAITKQRMMKIVADHETLDYRISDEMISVI